MKKIFLALAILLFIAGQSFANNSQQIKNVGKVSNSWWPGIQIVFWPGIPPYTDMDVYGLRTGFPVSGGTGAVDGLEITPFLSYSDYVYGFQASAFMNLSKKVEGIRCGVLNLSTDKVTGFQTGILNLDLNNSTGFELAPVNVTRGKMNGMQLGVANYATKQNGLQFGIFNMSEWSGIQIGLINIIEDGWLPFFPIINMSF